MLVMGFLSITAKVYSTAELGQDYKPISSFPLGSHNLLIYLGSNKIGRGGAAGGAAYI